MIQPIIDGSGVIHIYKGKQAEPIKLVIGDVLTAEIMDLFPTGTVQIKINNRIINAQMQREIPLNRGDTVYLKVEKPLSDGTIPLRVLSFAEVEDMRQEILRSQREIPEKLLKFLEAVFTEKESLIDNRASKPSSSPLQLDLQKPEGLAKSETLLQKLISTADAEFVHTLKSVLSLPVEKLPENVKEALIKSVFEFLSQGKSTSENIKEFISILERSPQFIEEAAKLKDLIVSLSDLKAEKLKKAVVDSGVFFEAKLKKALFEPARFEAVKDDLKAILQRIISSAQKEGLEGISEKAQGILRQIESYQVISKNFQSFFTFLPILWNEIEGGHIGFKSFKREGKDFHTVFVSLKVKEESSLSFVVTMINKSIFISFSGEEQVLNVIKAEEAELRESFLRSGLSLSGISYHTKIDDLIKQWNIKEGLVSLSA